MKKWQEEQPNVTEPSTNKLVVEELLGTFIAFPHIFRDYRQRLDKTMFQDLWWIYEMMCEVEDEEGLSYRGLVSRAATPQIKRLQEIKNLGYNERRADILFKEIKKEQSAQQIRSMALNTVACLDEGVDPDDVVRNLQKDVFTLYTTDTGELRDMKKQVDTYVDRMMSIVKDPSIAYGMMTGITPMDRITTGWHRKELSVVGARTSMGKSAFMLENINRISSMGYKCAVFSLEMDYNPMYDRLMANKLNVNLREYRFGRLTSDVYEEMIRRKHEIDQIYIDDQRGVDSHYISDTMRRLKRTQGLDFVVVDYLQDVAEKMEPGDNQGSALARVCRVIRKAAKDCDCHVMGLSQVARDAEKSQDKRPSNKDLSGSTGIETCADVIALLYREDYYNPDTPKQGVLEVNFTKQRNGEVGVVELRYDRKTQRITSLAG